MHQSRYISAKQALVTSTDQQSLSVSRPSTSPFISKMSPRSTLPVLPPSDDPLRPSHKPLARRSSLDKIKDLKTYFYNQEWPAVSFHTKEVRVVLLQTLAVLPLLLRSARSLVTPSVIVTSILLFLSAQCLVSIAFAVAHLAPAGFWFLSSCIAVITFALISIVVPEKDDKFFINVNKFF